MSEAPTPVENSQNPEREAVKSHIHWFFQEQAKKTPVHRSFEEKKRYGNPNEWDLENAELRALGKQLENERREIAKELLLSSDEYSKFLNYGISIFGSAHGYTHSLAFIDFGKNLTLPTGEVTHYILFKKNETTLNHLLHTLKNKWHITDDEWHNLSNVETESVSDEKSIKYQTNIDKNNTSDIISTNMSEENLRSTIEDKNQQNPEGDKPVASGENTAFAKKREEKIKLRGGVEEYQTLIKDYIKIAVRLDTKNQQPQSVSLLEKEVLFKDYIATRMVIHGEEKTRNAINAMNEDDKEKKKEELYKILTGGEYEFSNASLLDKITSLVTRRNRIELVSTGEGKDYENEIALLLENSNWKQKDISLLFIEHEENINQPATAGSTETQNNSDNAVDEATQPSTEEQTPTNHSAVEAPGNEAQTDTVVADITPADEAPAETEEEKQTREAKEQEKQKVITILHAFFQEQNKNTETHTKMANAIEAIKAICRRSLQYYPDMLPTGSNFILHENWIFNNKDYKEVVVYYLNPEKQSRSLLNPTNNLRLLTQDNKYRDNAELRELIDDYERVSKELLSLKDELWEEKESIASELLTVGFEQWQDQPLIKYHHGLYDTDGYLWIDKFNDKNQLLFTQKLHWLTEIDIQSLQERYNISNEELENIKKIAWNEEEKAKLSDFERASGFFSDEAVKEALFEDYVKQFPFTEGEIDSMVATAKRAMIRRCYREYDLPRQLESRIVTEIILGTFSF